MNRRSFLIRGMGALIALSSPLLSSLLGCRSTPKRRIENPNFSDLTKKDLHILAGVQEHLFPSEPDSPGAETVNALNNLKFFYANDDTDAEDRDLLKKGVIEINNITQRMVKKPFGTLSSEERERVLRHYEKTQDGERWLPLMLDIILEALLGDPVYGGNPKGVGWKWLDHRPGFPRPPIGKRYYEL